MASGQASVLYTFYPPLQAHWTYYLGLALLVVSTWVIAVALFMGLSAWRKENPGVRIPLLASSRWPPTPCGAWPPSGSRCRWWGFCSPGPWGSSDPLDPLLSRTLFWYSGHPIVYFWLLPAYVSWYMMVPARGG
jgi:cytochrome c oxidase subunit I